MDKDRQPNLTGNGIRKTFIDFFISKGHTFVPSSSLVPGGDATLLFTNAGMVQFKDVFLGTDKRPYTRAVNSQKSMRVAGKHNDLEDVGRNDTHHTFFEMLGNWSFGDYYKKEAIEWAWELLTNVWKLPQEQLYATVFKDELGEIPTDDEAAEHWLNQSGFSSDQIFYLGRKDNFWEMADTGPCGPCSEIHLDLRPDDGPVTAETLDTDRFVELWNLVFIQYNRTDPKTLRPLPATHVDTGLGFERIVAVLQNKNSNYRTDLLWPLIQKTQELTGHTDEERESNFTPYRVIADHARAAAFLIADGVVPGNLGRNYITRMIIRRAFRFGGKISLQEPFLAPVAKVVVERYGDAYPELQRNQDIILNQITREEEQFQRTLEKATGQLENLLQDLKAGGKDTLPGESAANLYTTYGMPLEITRDIAQERALDVDEPGFQKAMEEHRLASGAGKSMGPLGGEDVEVYREILHILQAKDKIDAEGVIYNPYGEIEFKGELLALVRENQSIERASKGDQVEVLLPETHFYIEAGGQVSDTGFIRGEDWVIRVTELRKPAAGIVAHNGEVIEGEPKVGDVVTAKVDAQRRKDIMRNHTATHLLHAALDKVLGRNARQAGSLVAPDRLRFDFTHPEELSKEELERIEADVNKRILEDHTLNITYKPLQQAVEEGARALFGEKYEASVRTITMGDFSYELCGGTHCNSTAEIGIFLITSEGSAAAGIRRIEAVTGCEAYKRIRKRFDVLNQTAALLSTTPDMILENT
ncbi:MAG: alanine--tRNA ligase, partial [Anaerolineales bacterium]